MADSELNIAEEGIVGAGIPGIGFTPLVALHVPDSHPTEVVMTAYTKLARKAAKESRRRVELVYFGPEGRKHVKWLDE